MKQYNYNLIQNGMIVASVSSASFKDAEREIQHYALLYAEDGPVRIRRNYKVIP